MSTLTLKGLTSGSSVLKAPDSGSNEVTFTMPASTGTLLTTTGSAANLTAIPAANITGTLPAISGASLTGITGKIKNGMVSFDLSSASDTEIVITSLGFTPTHIILQVVMSSTAQQVVMSMMGTSTRSIVTGPAATAGTYTWNNDPQILTGSGIYNLIDLESLDADGFTLGNTKSAGSPTGTAQIQWMAFG